MMLARCSAYSSLGLHCDSGSGVKYFLPWHGCGFSSYSLCWFVGKSRRSM
jgi:hypothetical protein